MTDSEPPASSWRTSEQPPLKRLSRYPERSRLAVPDADCSDFAPCNQLPDVALTDASSTRRLRNRHQRRCQDCLCALYALCALHAFPIGYYSHGEGATPNPRLNAPDHWRGAIPPHTREDGANPHGCARSAPFALVRHRYWHGFASRRSPVRSRYAPSLKQAEVAD